MRQIETALRLRIFLGEEDKYGPSAPEEIVTRAQQAGMAGATVFRGYTGYERASGLHMPVEDLDGHTEDKVTLVLERFHAGGAVTMEKAEKFCFPRKPKAGRPAGPFRLRSVACWYGAVIHKVASSVLLQFWANRGTGLRPY